MRRAMRVLRLELRRLAPGLAERGEGVDADSPLATVYVDSLRKAFFGEEWARAGKSRLTAEQRAALRPRLAPLTPLSELELRMFLAIHRRLRSGDRIELTERILDEVPEGYVFEMLATAAP
eukprot:gene1419-3088_t